MNAPKGACLNCGAPTGQNDGLADPSHCGKCPPWLCEDCGEMDAPPPNSCKCWTSFEGLPLADIKGLLALGGLSVDLARDDRIDG